jgi:hypothetical protein
MPEDLKYPASVKMTDAGVLRKANRSVLQQLASRNNWSAGELGNRVQLWSYTTILEK